MGNRKRENPNGPRRVYVVALRGGDVYVGQTALSPEERYRQHKRGGMGTSRDVQERGIGVVGTAGPYYSEEAAEQAERETARALRRAGVRVLGGH